MENSQKELCLEVLNRLSEAGILKHTIIVGSWCTLFYKNYFTTPDYFSALTTRDMDLLIPFPQAINKHVDIAELLEDLGFIVGFSGSQGYIRLEHPELILEFLVPERGRSSEKPYSLPQLGLNAQALRFMDFVTKYTISIKADNIDLTLPHPACFALQKLIIMSRRKSTDKASKDKDSAIRILNALISEGKEQTIIDIFLAMPKKWQKMVIKQLTEITDEPILNLLSDHK